MVPGTNNINFWNEIVVKYDCFVSYRKGNDSTIASDIAAHLQRLGFNVFIDSSELLPGEFSPQLESSIKEATYVVALFTLDYVERIEQGHDFNHNFIVEELNWAINSQHCTLMPVIVGMDTKEVFERCEPYAKNLSDYQAFCFNEPLPEDFYRDISDEILKLERKRYKQKDQSSEAQSELPADESPEDIYHKFRLPWPTNEALAYKAALEDKIVKLDIEHVHLALFYISGRFGIKIDNQKAIEYLQAAAGRGCKEALFELGLLYHYGDTNLGINEEKACGLYLQAYEKGCVEAVFQLSYLFDTEIENIQCPTAFLKQKYNVAVENPYDKIIQALGEKFSELNSAQQFGYLAYHTWPSGMSEQAQEQFSKLQESYFIPTLRYFGVCFLYGSAKNKHFQQNIELGLKMLAKAETMGCCHARYILAEFHLNSEFKDCGVIQSREVAFREHTENIELGYYDSAYAVYWEATNTKNCPYDEKTAFNWLKIGADDGNALCLNQIIKSYLNIKTCDIALYVDVENTNYGESWELKENSIQGIKSLVWYVLKNERLQYNQSFLDRLLKLFASAAWTSSNTEILGQELQNIKAIAFKRTSTDDYSLDNTAVYLWLLCLQTSDSRSHELIKQFGVPLRNKLFLEALESNWYRLTFIFDAKFVFILNTAAQGSNLLAKNWLASVLLGFANIELFRWVKNVIKEPLDVALKLLNVLVDNKADNGTLMLINNYSAPSERIRGKTLTAIKPNRELSVKGLYSLIELRRFIEAMNNEMHTQQAGPRQLVESYCQFSFTHLSWWTSINAPELGEEKTLWNWHFKFAKYVKVRVTHPNMLSLIAVCNTHIILRLSQNKNDVHKRINTNVLSLSRPGTMKPWLDEMYQFSLPVTIIRLINYHEQTGLITNKAFGHVLNLLNHLIDSSGSSVMQKGNFPGCMERINLLVSKETDIDQEIVRELQSKFAE
ncbi:TIR domain-containing protein [Alteromonas oceani]|uniref:TIR domain-containing protein n=1 Tax=Alteromonas oceani TaxID=2071609 RepID=A0ABV7JW08_9ALTE|nr:TIR domain-containing protein [Alteromonas oceani]